MRSRTRTVALLVALLVPVAIASSAASKTFNAPKLLSKQISSVKKKPHVPILVPQSIRLDVNRAYPAGGRQGGKAWSLEIDAIRGCGGAHVCFLADFLGERGTKLNLSGQRVTLTGGRRGVYHPVTCGASCAPASLQFLRSGARYTIQVGGGPNKKADLVGLANSALRRGPR